MASTQVNPFAPGSFLPGPRFIQCQRQANQFNGMLDSEAQLWDYINRCGGLSALCPGKKYIDPPWVKMPPQGKRYAKIGHLAYSPAIADGNDHLVPFTGGSFFIPQAHDGCIVSTVFQYTGQGFNEASGDITWRIQINQRYAKDYGKVITQIGSLTTPYNINSGQILVQSGNLIQIFVNIPATAIGNLNGGQIIGALFGWTWPR